MDILFATTFRNDQGSEAPSGRVLLETNSQSSVVNSVDASGYYHSANFVGIDSYFRLTVPKAKGTYNYYHATITTTAVWDPANTDTSIFGYVLPVSIATNNPTSFLIVERPDEALVYVDGKFTATMPKANVRPMIELQKIISTNRTQNIRITNLLVAESDEFKILSPTFVDQVLTLESNDWQFSGNSLIESTDKDNSITTDPRAIADSTGASFTVSVSETGLPLLIEGSGRVDYDPELLGLLVSGNATTKELGPLITTQSAVPGIVLKPSNTVTVTRTGAPMRILLEAQQNETVTVSCDVADSLTVYWGDGTSVVVGSGVSTHTHTYDAGKYELYVYGASSTMEVAGSPVVEFLDWGMVDGLTRLSFYVESEDVGSPNLRSVVNEVPETITSMANMFRLATSFSDPTIANWSTGNVENMDNMFNGASAFNQDLQLWCVSLISELPTGFDTNATSWSLSRPSWGTCPPRDPYWDNVELLINMVGTDGSTEIVDSSKYQRPIQNFNQALSMDMPLFDQTSMPSFGFQQYLNIDPANIPDLGLEDFTLEWFSYEPSEGYPNYAMYIDARISTSVQDWALYSPNRNVTLYAGAVTLGTPTNSVPLDQWNHIAITRNYSGGTLQMFINGVLSRTGTWSRNMTTGPWRIGRNISSLDDIAFNGYFGGIRVTRGVIRYTENFIPPAERFPGA